MAMPEDLPGGPDRRRRWAPRIAAVALVGAAALVASIVLPRAIHRPVAAFSLVAPEEGLARGHARVFRSGGGLEVALEVDGLPRPPEGSYYECWFVGGADSLEDPNRVSAGTFTVDRAGKARVRMLAAADLARFPAMGVTLEPGDGNPARTGPKVLVSQTGR